MQNGTNPKKGTCTPGTVNPPMASTMTPPTMPTTMAPPMMATTKAPAKTGSGGKASGGGKVTGRR